MDRTILEQSINELKQVSEASYEAYQLKADELILFMNQKMITRSDLGTLVGENNIHMMKDNHANHVRFMASVFKNLNTEVLLETVLWVFSSYTSHGFSSNYWSVQLNTWVEILKAELSDEVYTEIYPYYQWMIVNIPLFVKLSKQKV